MIHIYKSIHILLFNELFVIDNYYPSAQKSDPQPGEPRVGVGASSVPKNATLQGVGSNGVWGQKEY